MARPISWLRLDLSGTDHMYLAEAFQQCFGYLGNYDFHRRTAIVVGGECGTTGANMRPSASAWARPG